MARKQVLDQCRDLQMFNHEAEAAEGWMTKRESFLAGEEVGDSLDAVEALIKKHEDMDKSLQAQVLASQYNPFPSDPLTLSYSFCFIGGEDWSTAGVC